MSSSQPSGTPGSNGPWWIPAAKNGKSNLITRSNAILLAFVAGLQTMMIKARGGKTEFFLTDSVDPQSIYNSARNVEIAAWKLSNTRDEAGKLYFQTNEINGKEQNLSFEREIGRMAGRIDLYALTLSEKSQRGLT